MALAPQAASSSDSNPAESEGQHIDAPEARQPWSKESRQHLSDMVLDKAVKVEWRKQDRYGRIVGKLTLQAPPCATCPKTIDAGLAQLEAGLAWWDRETRREQSLSDQGYYEYAEFDVEGESCSSQVCARNEEQPLIREYTFRVQHTPDLGAALRLRDRSLVERPDQDLHRLRELWIQRSDWIAVILTATRIGRFEYELNRYAPLDCSQEGLLYRLDAVDRE